MPCKISSSKPSRGGTRRLDRSHEILLPNALENSAWTQIPSSPSWSESLAKKYPYRISVLAELIRYCYSFTYSTLVTTPTFQAGAMNPLRRYPQTHPHLISLAKVSSLLIFPHSDAFVFKIGEVVLGEAELLPRCRLRQSLHLVGIELESFRVFFHDVLGLV